MLKKRLDEILLERDLVDSLHQLLRPLVTDLDRPGVELLSKRLALLREPTLDLLVLQDILVVLPQASSAFCVSPHTWKFFASSEL